MVNRLIRNTTSIGGNDPETPDSDPGMPAVVVEHLEWVLSLFFYWDLKAGRKNKLVLNWRFF